MEEAQELCDRLLVMDKGKVLDSGKPDDLVRKSLPRFVLELPASYRKDSWPTGIQAEIHGDKLFLYCQSSEALEKAAVELKGDFRIRTTGLEDLFLKLTGRDLHESE